jgi:hypothetical protein
MRPLILIALATALTSGCASGIQSSGRLIDAEKVAEIEIGVSTKQDVLDAFGPPADYNRVAAFPFETLNSRLREQAPLETKESEDVFTYEYVEDDESFFSAILYTRYRRKTLTDTLMVFFDAKDLVKYIAFAKQTRVGTSGGSADSGE